jgi:hypothetical protein
MKRLALVFAALVVVLSGCILYPGQHVGPVDQNADNLGGARFAQTQAVQGFDTSSYTLTDEQLEDFRDLLDRYLIDPGDYRTSDTDGCAGGITTRVQMWFHDNGDKEMIIDGCAADEGTFERDATDLFSSIRDGSWTPDGQTSERSIDALTRIEFSQTQAVPDFDSGTYVLDSPDVLQQFRDLLTEHDIVPWEYTAPSTEGCAGGVTTTATLSYDDAEPDQLVIDGCAAPDGSFESDATEFFRQVKG